jgi:acyl dehydratase
LAIRGVYSAEEEKMLANWRAIQEAEARWIGDEITPENPAPVLHRIASKDLVLNNAIGIGDRNPLWRDENYAKHTRWGGIIAPPLFPYVIYYSGPMTGFNIPASLGSKGRGPFGPKWEFFKPIHVGDSFRVRGGKSFIEDKTSPDGTGPRTFLISNGKEFINQNNELVCINFFRELIVILPPGEKEPEHHEKQPEYVYSKEELSFIDQIYAEEEIRGANPRYWEDVNEGDDLKPTVTGPVTIWDQVVEIAGRGVLVSNVNEMRRKTPQSVMVDPATGVFHNRAELHISERISQLRGHPQVNIGRDFTEESLCRLVTNWMGDDAFLTMFDSTQGVMIPMGDTFFCKGKVSGKRIENGAHLIDLELHAETIRGITAISGTATVRLLSRIQSDKRATTGMRQNTTI